MPHHATVHGVDTLVLMKDRHKKMRDITAKYASVTNPVKVEYTFRRFAKTCLETMVSQRRIHQKYDHNLGRLYYVEIPTRMLPSAFQADLQETYLLTRLIQAISEEGYPYKPIIVSERQVPVPQRTVRLEVQERRPFHMWCLDVVFTFQNPTRADVQRIRLRFPMFEHFEIRSYAYTAGVKDYRRPDKWKNLWKRLLEAHIHDHFHEHQPEHFYARQ